MFRMLGRMTHKNMLQDLQHELNFLIQRGCSERNCELEDSFSYYWVLLPESVHAGRFFASSSYIKIQLK
jgi:hypothetical protein